MTGIERRPGSLTFLWVGMVLLITAGGLFIALVPVVRAPRCSALLYDSAGESIFYSDGSVVTGTRDPCSGGIRITLLARWQGKSWWEGSTIGVRAARGFKRTNSTAMLDRTGIRIGVSITKPILEDARAALMDTGESRSVQIEVMHYPEDSGKVKVLTVVDEK
jgi:hypothetical protein